jgi:cupin domain/carboxypeptidase family protein
VSGACTESNSDRTPKYANVVVGYDPPGKETGKLNSRQGAALPLEPSAAVNLGNIGRSRMISVLIAGVAVAVALTTTNAQSTSRGSERKPAAAPRRATSVRISVRDQHRATIAGVHLLLSGAAAGGFTTGATGTAVIPNVKEGLYRVRCERAGFITLEREFTVRTGARNAIDVILNVAPAPPVAKSPPASPSPQSGPLVAISIPDFLDRNFIGKGPVKESILACTPQETVRLLQMREGSAPHVHDRVDEIIYVVAGEGTLLLGKDTVPLRAASLVVVPRGRDHAFERRGRKPLIVVSTLAGTACEQGATAR